MTPQVFSNMRATAGESQGDDFVNSQTKINALTNGGKIMFVSKQEIKQHRRPLTNGHIYSGRSDNKNTNHQSPYLIEKVTPRIYEKVKTDLVKIPSLNSLTSSARKTSAYKDLEAASLNCLNFRQSSSYELEADYFYCIASNVEVPTDKQMHSLKKISQTIG